MQLGNFGNTFESPSEVRAKLSNHLKCCFIYIGFLKASFFGESLYKKINSSFILGESIRCFVGNASPTLENVVDCDTLGIQREELYCRNITVINGKTTDVQRNCVAMSW